MKKSKLWLISGLISTILALYMLNELYIDYITDYEIDTEWWLIGINIILFFVGYSCIKIFMDSKKTEIDPDSLDKTKTIMEEDL